MLYAKSGKIFVTLVALYLAAVAAAPAEPQRQTSRERAPRKGSKAVSEKDQFLNGKTFQFDELLKAVESVYPVRLKEAIQRRGVGFQLSEAQLALLKEAGASTDIIDLLKNSVWVAPAPAVVAAPRVETGSVVAECEPAECEIAINGKPYGSTKGSTLTADGLRLGPVVIDFTKSGYVSEQKIVAVTAGPAVASRVRLVPDSSTKKAFGEAVFEKLIDALGGKSAVSEWGGLLASGKAGLWNDKGERTDLTATVRLKSPNWINVEMKNNRASFWLSLLGDVRKSSRNFNKLSEADDIETGVRLFREYQLTELLRRFTADHTRLQADSPEASMPGVLRAESKMGSCDLSFNAETLPIGAKCENLGTNSGVAVSYQNYKSLGTSRYPMTTIVRLPDAAGQKGIELVFDSITLKLNFRDKDFHK